MTEKTPSHILRAQVQHLNGMLYVWVGGVSSFEGALPAPSQPNMVVAHPPRTYKGTAAATSATTVLFGEDSLPAVAISAAGKLATWAKQPVFMSWDLKLSAADEQEGIADDAVAVMKKAVQSAAQ